MSDHDQSDPLARIGRLEEIAVQVVPAMNLVADQLLALYVVNAALMGFLRDRGGVDIEMVRVKVLEVLGEGAGNPTVLAHADALLGPFKPDAAPLSEEEERDRLREIARSRFTVIDGGRPPEE